MLRVGEVKKLAHSHTTGKQHNCDVNWSLLAVNCILFTPVF